MERDQEPLPKRQPADPAKLGRTWTRRYSGPVVYCRYSGIDAGGEPRIFIKVDAPNGPSELAIAVHDAINQLKHVDRGTGGSRPTGLTFTRDRIHGRLYKLPDNPLGRFAADLIDAKLSYLAEKVEKGRGRS